MNKKKGFVVAVTLVTAALGFGENMFSDGRQGKGFDYPDKSYEFRVTTDEIKDILNSGGGKSSPMDTLNADLAKLSSEASTENVLENKVNPEEIRPLAEAGNPHFQFHLGRCYALGEGVAQDYEQALH